MSRWLGLPLKPWDEHTLKDRKSGDVLGYEVKTRRDKYSDIQLTDDDPDDRKFILVRAFYRPLFEVVGWTFGYEAKQDQYKLHKPHMTRPCYYYPHKKLRTLSTLKGELKHEELLNL